MKKSSSGRPKPSTVTAAIVPSDGVLLPYARVLLRRYVSSNVIVSASLFPKTRVMLHVSGSDASADAQLFVIEPGHAKAPLQPDHSSPCRCIVVP